jgi:hypothetical protein
LIPTVAEGTVALYFEEETLVRWTVIEPDWLAGLRNGGGSSGYTHSDLFPSFPTKDSRHHDRGHKHHHGHGC